MRNVRIGTCSLLLTLAIATTAGCSSDDTADGGDTPASPSSAAGESPAAGDDEPASTQRLPDMGEDFAGILADVTTEECTTDKGDAVARGTVVNSADTAKDILVAVIWLKPDSGDTVALKSREFKDVEPGATNDWSMKAKLGSAAGQCVIQAKANDAGTLP